MNRDYIDDIDFVLSHMDDIRVGKMKYLYALLSISIFLIFRIENQCLVWRLQFNHQLN